MFKCVKENTFFDEKIENLSKKKEKIITSNVNDKKEPVKNHRTTKSIISIDDPT